ncbi:MAG: phage holin family protein [Lewinellaceae bacterium]|nr:phage holin family protein [Lewinellaceae bacterium]
MSEEKNKEPSLEELLQKGLQHLETRWEYLSLSVTEKLSGAASAFAGAAVIFFFTLIILFFFSIGFALWLGGYLQNAAAGFALAGLIFVPIGIGMYYWIRPFVRNKVIQSLLEDDTTKKHNEGG